MELDVLMPMPVSFIYFLLGETVFISSANEMSLS